MATITDDFTGADSATSLNGRTTTTGGKTWNVSVNAFGIILNTAYRSSGASHEAAWVDSGTSDGRSEIVITGNNGDCGVVGRLTDNNNYYLLYIPSPGGNSVLYKRVAGTFTSILASLAVAASGDTVGIDCTGTTIAYYLNGSVSNSVTDSAITTGTGWGFHNDNASAARYDNFVLTYTPPAALIVPRRFANLAVMRAAVR